MKCELHCLKICINKKDQLFHSLLSFLCLNNPLSLAPTTIYQSMTIMVLDILSVHYYVSLIRIPHIHLAGIHKVSVGIQGTTFRREAFTPEHYQVSCQKVSRAKCHYL